MNGKLKRKTVKTIRRLIWSDLCNRRGYDLSALDNSTQLEIMQTWDRIIDKQFHLFIFGKGHWGEVVSETMETKLATIRETAMGAWRVVIGRSFIGYAWKNKEAAQEDADGLNKAADARAASLVAEAVKKERELWESEIGGLKMFVLTDSGKKMTTVKEDVDRRRLSRSEGGKP